MQYHCNITAIYQDNHRILEKEIHSPLREKPNSKVDDSSVNDAVKHKHRRREAGIVCVTRQTTSGGTGCTWVKVAHPS